MLMLLLFRILSLLQGTYMKISLINHSLIQLYIVLMSFEAALMLMHSGFNKIGYLVNTIK